MSLMGRYDRTPMQRIIDLSTIGECYEWNGSRRQGYGRVRVRGRMLSVHRVVWESLIGPIPDGLEVDHMCRNGACWNPEHLRLVTAKENSADNIRHACRRGHRLLPHNRAANGSCVICNNARESARYKGETF